jgi:hypothetical protein
VAVHRGGRDEAGDPRRARSLDGEGTVLVRYERPPTRTRTASVPAGSVAPLAATVEARIDPSASRSTRSTPPARSRAASRVESTAIPPTTSRPAALEHDGSASRDRRAPSPMSGDRSVATSAPSVPCTARKSSPRRTRRSARSRRARERRPCARDRAASASGPCPGSGSGAPCIPVGPESSLQRVERLREALLGLHADHALDPVGEDERRQRERSKATSADPAMILERRDLMVRRSPGSR